jgi:2-dehydro-3-deoxygluconokinase
VELVSPARIAVIGEGMLELTLQDGAWQVGTAGDALNVAAHLARFGRQVDFVSALGADAISDHLRRAWAAEGVGVDHVLTDPTRGPGLYAVNVDPAGERSFTYWRSDSAARALFSSPDIEIALAGAARAELLYFSLISLAVIPPGGRDRLMKLCADVRAAGGRVAFDTNYRPRLWSDQHEARAEAARFMTVTDIGLPTFDDEAQLFADAAPETTARRWRAAGAREVAVKFGRAGCLLSAGDVEKIVAPPETLDPIDTSGAGDGFNAGYLDARLRDESPRSSAIAGHRLAGWVVRRPGALPARDADFVYDQIRSTST